MIPTLHVPCALTLTPANVDGVHGAVEDLFTLRIQYVKDGLWQVHLAAHVPKSLQEAMSSGKVESFHLETLEPNSPAAAALPGHPTYLILGVRLKDGPELHGVPQVLRSARIGLLVAGTGLSAIGAGLIWWAHPWLGAACFATGTHLIRTGRQVPSRPFVVVRRRV